MIRFIVIRVLFLLVTAFSVGMLLASMAKAESKAPYIREPLISIYQGTEKDTSVLVLQWPSGKIERLVIKNSDMKAGKHVEWFKERVKANEG